jgi:hypothetical protein
MPVSREQSRWWRVSISLDRIHESIGASCDSFTGRRREIAKLDRPFLLDAQFAQSSTHLLSCFVIVLQELKCQTEALRTMQVIERSNCNCVAVGDGL